jgi:hypothetical protein
MKRRKPRFTLRPKAHNPYLPSRVRSPSARIG